MFKIKVLTLIYFVMLAVGLGVLLNICVSLNSLLTSHISIDILTNQYGSLQKSAGLWGIVFFVILLILGLVLYYLSTKKTYIVLTNILYIGLVLFIFITANRSYFAVQNVDYSNKGEYWLTVFMGIFYIIGAVLVSAIGYITVRNYAKRSQHTLNKK
ncbi:MAG: hypothetical protein PF517_18805 [Salinivirgaceae bacterium]|jgi:hypothetical protein|nr:hypothetical protein [Salinivirgaceae bacterium]